MKLLADLSAVTPVQRPPTPANTDGVTFSILMAAYRAQEHIGAAVASVLAQTRTDWELIIVDDHSPDKLGEQVAPFRTDPRIGYVRLAENGGCSVARNVAATMARGQYFVVVDADDLLEPTFLERTAREIDAGADVVATCAVRFYEDGMAPLCENDPPPLDQSDRERAFVQILRGPFFYNGLTFNRTLYEAAGGFDENLRNAEDLDLWFRVAATGCKVHTVHDPTYRYRVQANSGSRGSNEHTQQFAAAELRIMESLARRITMTDERHRALTEHSRAARTALHLSRARLAFRAGDGVAMRREAVRLLRVRPSVRAVAMAIGSFLPSIAMTAVEKALRTAKALRKTT